MPYVQVDLDAISASPSLARAMGITEHSALAGLILMWEWCWRTRSDCVSRMQILAFFGPHADIGPDALIGFGFLESDGTTFRVRGAGRRLFVAARQSAGGHAKKSNLVPGYHGRKSTGSTRRGPGGGAGEDPSTHPEQVPALASTVNYLQSTRLEEEAKVVGAEAPQAAGAAARSLKSLWNELAAPRGLPKWLGMSAARARQVALRVREQPDMAVWAEGLRRMAASSFLRGTNDRGWRASPDWLLRPDSLTRILEGKYDPAPGKTSAGPINTNDTDWDSWHPKLTETGDIAL